MNAWLGTLLPLALFVVAVAMATGRKRKKVFWSFGKDPKRTASAKLSRLRQSGFLAKWAESLFYALQWTSLSTWRYGTRSAATNSDNTWGETDERAGFVDYLVVAWLAICVVGLVLLAREPSNLTLRNAFLCCALLRIADIIQAQINAHIWDSVRIEKDDKVASLQRPLLLAGINYVEFVGWFAPHLSRTEPGSGELRLQLQGRSCHPRHA